jgi:biopolymer transport protein TolR
VSLRRLKKRKIQMPEVSLTPLIDTALTLLVIFMVTAPMVQNGIKLDLPHGKSKEAPSQQEFVVSLNKDRVLYFNSCPIERENLTGLVLKSLEQKEDSPVFVRADGAVAYGDVIGIVDDLKQAGVKYVAMSTRPNA